MCIHKQIALQIKANWKKTTTNSTENHECTEIQNEGESDEQITPEILFISISKVKSLTINAICYRANNIHLLLHK